MVYSNSVSDRAGDAEAMPVPDVFLKFSEDYLVNVHWLGRHRMP